MAYSTAALRTAYETLITAKWSTASVEKAQAQIYLENYLSALDSEYAGAGSHLQEYTIAGRTMKYRGANMRGGGRTSDYWRNKLDLLLGRSCTVSLIDQSHSGGAQGVT